MAHLISTYLMDILQWSSQTLTSWQTQDSSFWLVMEIYNGGSVSWVLATSWKLQITVLEAKEEQIFNQHGSTFSSNFRCFQPKDPLPIIVSSIHVFCSIFTYMNGWFLYGINSLVFLQPFVHEVVICWAKSWSTTWNATRKPAGFLNTVFFSTEKHTNDHRFCLHDMGGCI